MEGKKTGKEQILDYFLVVAGSFLLAISTSFFVLPFEILTGGVAGIAVVVASVFDVSSEFVVNGLTVSLFVVGWIFLGKGFAARTFLSSLLYPLFVSLLNTTGIVLDLDPIVATAYAGVFMGAGVGLVFRTGASTGGMDVPPLIVHKITGIDLSNLVLLTDALTVLAGISVFGIEKALVGMISVYVSSILIDKMLLLGGHQAKAVYIISDKYEDIRNDVASKIGRGTTLLEAQGGYTGKERKVLLVVLSQKQYPELNRIVMHRDPTAFVIVSDTTEVKGEGFTYPTPDE